MPAQRHRRSTNHANECGPGFVLFRRHDSLSFYHAEREPPILGTLSQCRPRASSRLPTFRSWSFLFGSVSNTSWSQHDLRRRVEVNRRACWIWSTTCPARRCRWRRRRTCPWARGKTAACDVSSRCRSVRSRPVQVTELAADVTEPLEYTANGRHQFVPGRILQHVPPTAAASPRLKQIASVNMV